MCERKREMGEVLISLYVKSELNWGKPWPKSHLPCHSRLACKIVCLYAAHIAGMRKKHHHSFPSSSDISVAGKDCIVMTVYLTAGSTHLTSGHVALAVRQRVRQTANPPWPSLLEKVRRVGRRKWWISSCLWVLQLAPTTHTILKVWAQSDIKCELGYCFPQTNVITR